MNKSKVKDTVTLIDNKSGRQFEFPIIEGSTGPDVIDVRKLYAETGYFTYDPGFKSTGSCESAITFIDGEKGILRHRGYSIEELAEKSNFLEVCYLLIYGELPKAEQFKEFSDHITHHTLLHEQMYNFFKGFRRDSHPMAIMCGAAGALSAFYHDSTDITDAECRIVASYRLIAKMPTIATVSYKYSIGQPFVYPLNKLSYTENFLHMMNSTPCEDYQVNPVLARALDRLFILHADHEQNASTSSMRLAASSGANPFASIAAGIASLWGPAHGGANEAVLNMLMEIGAKGRIGEYIKRAKDRDDPFRLMGFGHRVYKNHDPRARVLKESCHEVLGELGIDNDPLLELAMELERIALEDDYFIEKKLFPNVDFYSGIIYRALGIPTSMFTVMFAMARSAGWVAQWNELIKDPTTNIGRPRQLYTGQVERRYTPIDKR